MTPRAQPDEPVDPDVDVHVPDQRTEISRTRGAVLAVIGLGGGLGALARYGMSQALPTAPGRFPWATFAENVLGCLLIGVLMVLVTEVWTAHRLVRPFLGVGVLGGFTTFSTYAVEFRELLQPESVPLAFAYLGATMLCALLAALLGMWLARSLAARKSAVASAERSRS